MPAQYAVDDTIGAAFVGLVLSSIFLGVSFLQVYVYFSEKSEIHHTLLRLFAVGLLACNALHLALSAHFVYFYTVTNYGDYDALDSNVWSLEIQLGIAGLLAFLVQLFYAWRIYTLSGNKNWWLSCMVALCSLGPLVAAIGAAIAGFQHNLDISGTDIAWSTAGLSVEIVGNVLITGGMLYYVWTTVETQRRVYAVVMYGFNSGLLSTVFSVILLSVYLTHKHSLLPIPFFFILARVYVCSCLSTLNMHQVMQPPSTTSRQSFLTTIGSNGDDSATNKPESQTEVYVMTSKVSM